MTEERMRILNLLQQGKIDAAQAATLLDALGAAPPPAAGPSAPAPERGPRPPLRWLRVVVEGGPHDRVNVRVPFDLIRAGVRLASFLPPGVTDKLNAALRENGLDVDVTRLRPEGLEELVAHLGELSIDVDGDGDRVRIFCE